MKEISKETKTEIAVKMVILEAKEKGKTNTNMLIDYMRSDVFKNAVNDYISMM